jgi:nucleoside-diphosphate-sugar epimerase
VSEPIFILGGKGFVGSAFARVCAERGLDFVVIDRQSYRDVVGRRCGLFVNANGNSRKPLASQAPLEEFDASVRSVRQSIIDFPCEQYVHLSSCDVYPNCSSPATTCEDQALDPRQQSPYGFHKYLAELCVRHAAPSWLVVRLGGFVGPGLRKNAIFDILHGGPLWLDPASELQFMSTDAAAQIVLDLAADGPRNEVVNVCGRGIIQLDEVMQLVGREVPVNPGSPVVHYNVSIEKASRRVQLPPTRQTVAEFVRGWRG